MGSPPSAEPLAPRWRLASLAASRAGVATQAVVALENAGTATWRSVGADGLQVSYHWLDLHGNAIVWDGAAVRVPSARRAGRERELTVAVVAPRAPGRYLLRFDLVEEHHFWLSEIGADVLDVEVDVAARIAARRLEVVVHGGPHPDTSRALAASGRADRRGVTRVAVAHLVSGASPTRTGRASCSTPMRRAGRRSARRSSPVGGPRERRRAARTLGRLGARRPQSSLRPAAPPPVSPRRGRAVGEHDGLPAYVGDDGLFEGAAVVRLPTRSGRPPR